MRRVEQIENSKASFDEYMKYGWGQDDWFLTAEDIRWLRKGGALAFCDGEYTHTIILGKRGESK